MKLLLFSKALQAKLFGEQRLVFLDSKNYSENSSETQAIAKVEKVLDSGQKPTEQEKYLMRKYKKHDLLRKRETEINKLLRAEDEQIEGILAHKNLDGLTEDDKQKIASMPIQGALENFSPAIWQKYLIVIEQIISTGKPASVSIELRKQANTELTASFLNKHKKDHPELTDLRQIIDGKNQDEIVTRSAEDIADARITAQETQKSVQEQAGLEKDFAKKKKDILGAITGVLSDEQVKNAEKILQKENAEYQGQIAELIQVAMEKRIDQAVRGSVAEAITESKKCDQFIQDLIAIIFEGRSEGVAITEGYKRKSKMRMAQLTMLENSQNDKTKILNELQNNNLLESEEGEIAQQVLSQQKNLEQEVAAACANQHARFKQAVVRFREHIRQQGMNAHAFAKDFGIKKEYVNKQFMQDVIEGAFEIPFEYYEKSEEIAQKYGLQANQLSLVARGSELHTTVDLSQEKAFLQKALVSPQKIKAVQKPKSFLRDFLSYKTQHTTPHLLERIFRQLAAEEAEVLDCLIAPSPEVLDKKYQKIQKELDNDNVSQIRAKLQELQKINKELASKVAPAEAAVFQRRATEIAQQIADMDAEESVSPSEEDWRALLADNDPAEMTGANFALDVTQKKVDEGRQVAKNLSAELDVSRQLLNKKPENIGAHLYGDLDTYATEAKAISKFERGKSEQEMLQEQKIKDFAQLKNLLLERLGGTSSNLLKKLQNMSNLGNTPVLHILNDEEFNKKVKNPKQDAEMFLKNGELNIYVRESASNKEELIAHEAAHAIDSFTNNQASKKLLKILKSRFGDTPAFLNLQNKFNRNPDYRHKDFAHELFARLFANHLDSPEWASLAQEIGAENLSSILEECLPDDAELQKNVQQKLKSNKHWFSKSEKYAAIDTADSAQAVSSGMKPERRKKLVGLFDNRREVLKHKIHSLSKSNAKGKDEFVSVLQGHLNELESVINSPDLSEKDFENIMGDEHMEKLISSANAALSHIADCSTSQDNYFKSLWNNTTFLSLKDIRTIWTTFDDYMKRRHERNSKRRAGEVGSAMMDGIHNKLAAEYDLQCESAEKEEVSKYGESLDNKDAWQVYDRIEKTRNIDELKACLRDLAKKGMIDWRDQRIWDAVHHFQTAVRFYESDRDDNTVLRQKMNKALAILYDNDEFNDLERDNQSSYDNKKSGYDKEANVLGNNIGGHINKMLLNHRSGREKVEPHRYEMYLEFAIKRGFCTPEQILYYLMQGVYSGLLNPDRPVIFSSSLNNNFPALEIIHMKKPTLDQWKKWGAMFETDNGMMPPEFKQWMHTNWLTDRFVVERTIKSASQKLWDHDWMDVIASMGSSTSAKTISGTDVDGTPTYPVTAYPNTINAILHHFTATARNANDLSRDELIKDWSRQIGYASTLDAILYKRAFKSNKQLFRLSEGEKEYTARSNGYAADTTLSTKDTSRRTIQIMAKIAPEIFGELFNSKPDIAKLQSLLTTGKYSYVFAKSDPPVEPPNTGNPDDIDWYFDNTEIIAKEIFENDPNALQSMIKEAQDIYANDHKSSVDKLKPWNWLSKEGESPYLFKNKTN